ncbi:MAG: DoxX family protein [Gemmataceae bacterium]
MNNIDWLTDPLTIVLAGTVLVSLFVYLTHRVATGTGVKQMEPNMGTRVFLVLLRLAIGWHLLVEGVDKIQDPSWTSDSYLRAATGPLAPKFRELASNEAIEKMTLGENDTFPPALAKDWQATYDQFVTHYELSDKQEEDAKKALENAKTTTLNWMKTSANRPASVSTTVSGQAALNVPMRVAYYKQTLERIEKIEKEKLPRYSPMIEKDAQRELNRSIGEQRRNGYPPLTENEKIEQLNKIKIKLRDKAHDELRTAQKELIKTYNSLKSDMESKTLSMEKALRDVLDEEQLEKAPPTKSRLDNIRETPLPQWRDLIVSYGLTIAGGCLILGLFTSLAAVFSALLLVMFYAAMPPLPDWPANPKAEGTYLYINKNIIEMLALFVLATVPSGRWVGLDGLVPFLAFWRGKKKDKDTQPGQQQQQHSA